jgi:hypothetical protein
MLLDTSLEALQECQQYAHGSACLAKSKIIATKQEFILLRSPSRLGFNIPLSPNIHVTYYNEQKLSELEKEDAEFTGIKFRMVGCQKKSYL